MYLYGIYEVAKYWLEPTPVRYCHELFINTDVWEELPPDIQAAMEVAVESWSWRTARIYAYDGAEALEKMKEAGVTVTWLSEADQGKMLEVVLEVWDDVAGDDPEALEAVRIVKDYWKHLGKL